MRLGVHHQTTRIVLGFTKDLDPSRAQDLSNYTITLPGRDGRFGTADDRVIPLRSAVYDPVTRTVTLTTSHQLALQTAPPDHRQRLNARRVDRPVRAPAGWGR